MALNSESIEFTRIDSKACQCKTCKSQRQYQKTHPEQHNMTVKRHYVKHRDGILLSKAYARYFRGNRPHKRTLIRLIDAGFSISSKTIAKYGVGLKDSGSYHLVKLLILWKLLFHNDQ
jgi:hypothetical protein